MEEDKKRCRFIVMGEYVKTFLFRNQRFRQRQFRNQRFRQRQFRNKIDKIKFHKLSKYAHHIPHHTFLFGRNNHI
jgi:hypothetical protein